jgi:hypothetical protein
MTDGAVADGNGGIDRPDAGRSPEARRDNRCFSRLFSATIGQSEAGIGSDATHRFWQVIHLRRHAVRQPNRTGMGAAPVLVLLILAANIVGQSLSRRQFSDWSNSYDHPQPRWKNVQMAEDKEDGRGTAETE